MYGRSHMNVNFKLNLAQYRRLRATSHTCTFSTLPLLYLRAYAWRNNYATVESTLRFDFRRSLRSGLIRFRPPRRDFREKERGPIIMEAISYEGCSKGGYSALFNYGQIVFQWISIRETNGKLSVHFVILFPLLS